MLLSKKDEANEVEINVDLIGFKAFCRGADTLLSKGLRNKATA